MARSTPSALIWRTVSSMNGCQFLFPSTAQAEASGRERGPDRPEQLLALVVNRAHAAVGVIMPGHLGQPLRRHARPRVTFSRNGSTSSGPSGPPEGQQQESVVSRHASIQPGRARGVVSGRRQAEQGNRTPGKLVATWEYLQVSG